MSFRSLVLTLTCFATVAAVIAAARAGDAATADASAGAIQPAASHGPDYDRLRHEHWAYQPIRDVKPPQVKDAGWARDDIDRFILRKLEQQDLKPAADADRVTLIRRLYFDMIGLPPTPEQIDAFANDTSIDAYEKRVDELLASPRFGERWGRHWLDVARYAESLTLRGFVLKDAWRYRDYVIDTFNSDRPFDQFMQEQVAGDLMTGDIEQRRRHLTGTAFLAMGNTNLEEQDKKQLDMDVVDEQLETVGRAFLAQTIGCARCHDHKFDPIPTADYYAMAGILKNMKVLNHANVSKWLEIPLPETPQREAELKQYESAVASLTSQVKKLKAAVAGTKADALDTVAKKGAPVIVAVKDLPGVVVDDSDAKKVGEWKASTSVSTFIGSGYVTDNNTLKGESTLTFEPELPHPGKYEVRFAYTRGKNRARNVPVTVFSADGEKMIEIDEQETPPIDGRFISLGQYNFEKAGQSYVLVANAGTKGFVIADAVQFIPVELLGNPPAAAVAKSPATAAQPSSAASEMEHKLHDAESLLKKLTDGGPKRDTVLSISEGTQFADIPIHMRGNVHTLGAVVPRGFLSCVKVSHPPTIPPNGSGRLQLGRWLADPENPLPARVMANRCWHWLFGEGIVRTVDNFGTTGEVPSDPELLDYLATGFVENGWSVKKLVRKIVLSHTYRLSSHPDAALAAADPEDRLFGHAARRRLDAECIRDAILSASGKLDLTMGGPSYKAGTAADYGFKQTDTRRSVYSPVFRNALPELFEAFDFPDPSTPTGRRNISTVAPQALFLMNHPFVKEQATAAAERLLAEPGLDDAARIERAYRLTLGRSPTDGERRVAAEFIQSVKDEAEQKRAWTEQYHALFASMDFRFVQ